MRRFILTLAVAIFTHFNFVLGTIPGNQAPVVTFIYPTNTVALYAPGSPLHIRANAFDPDGNSIRQVRLLHNGVPVAVDLQAPYEFIFTAPSFGDHALQLEATDDPGTSGLSLSRLVQVVRVQDNFVLNMNPAMGTNVVLRSSNVEATHQKAEPQHAGVPGGKSVWFAWRATVTGTVIMDTVGSDFDTVLAVYTNRIQSETLTSVLSNLVSVASSDNDSAIAPLSRVKFTALANNTYYIAVDGRDGFAGNVQLAIRQTRTQAPAHDHLANAMRIFQGQFAGGSNAEASKELGEPDHAGNPGGKSLWFRVDLGQLTPVRITTDGSTFDTVLAVYTNTAGRFVQANVPARMEDLRLVAANDDGEGTNRTSEVTIVPQTFGASYWIAVDGYNGAEGTVRLVVGSQGVQQPVPRNDRFMNAMVLEGRSVLNTANTSLAGSEVGEPPALTTNRNGRSVWYRWVAPASGPVYLSTEFSSFDTLLGVYLGTNITQLLPVAFNDDDGGLRTSALVFEAIEGVEYRIAVAGYQGAGGEMVLLLNQPKATLPRMITQWTGGRMILSVAAASETMVLEASADLVHWEAVRTVSEEEHLEIEPVNGVPRQFYRLRTVE